MSKDDEIFVLNAIDLKRLLINGILFYYKNTLIRNRTIHQMISSEVNPNLD